MPITRVLRRQNNFSFILKLRNLQMEDDLILRLIHVSRDQMIDCGVDKLSRCCPTEGVMKGESILSFIPLHLSAEE